MSEEVFSNKPKLQACPLCQKQFGSASLGPHLKKCEQRAAEAKAVLDKQVISSVRVHDTIVKNKNKAQPRPKTAAPSSRGGGSTNASSDSAATDANNAYSEEKQRAEPEPPVEHFPYNEPVRVTSLERVPSLQQMCIRKVVKTLDGVKKGNEYYQDSQQAQLLSSLPENLLQAITVRQAFEINQQKKEIRQLQAQLAKREEKEDFIRQLQGELVLLRRSRNTFEVREKEAAQALQEAGREETILRTQIGTLEQRLAKSAETNDKLKAEKTALADQLSKLSDAHKKETDKLKAMLGEKERAWKQLQAKIKSGTATAT